ncbi:transcriptional regulator [Paenibacillus sp. J31TS4]|uniref:helix-turn-helix transcriptional regulator n=1 Tax=Paenibacillus sp. J31TS4 TaxID=2807195 RepID=UPI001B10B37A|nr:YafY family protein [Paenibacillus sp. J31TS4]GIP40695.1 transcriptional regulator [Paenibacillus sp. J31TS4]
MRADRLLALLLLLQNHGRWSARELAERLEVSVRTISRDMDALSAAGIPVYAERGANGGWVLAESYRTKLTGLKPEELVTLLAPSFGQLGDLGWARHADAARQKLLAEAPARVRQQAEDVRRKLHIDGAGWRQADEEVPWLPAVQEAVWGERVLRIRYQRGDEQVERAVHPLGLVAKRSTWYLIAACEGELRTYRISRLRHAEVLPDGFERPAGFELAAHWEQSMTQFREQLPSYPVRLRLPEAGLARLLRERYGRLLGTSPGRESEGTIEAEIDLQTADWAYGAVLSLGRQAVVLGPPELRERVRAEAAAIASLYGEGNEAET